MSFTYDEVPYLSQPFIQTHPDTLATVGTLFGMAPAPVNGCRVLEIACADGGNLIPMATELPGSEFVGIDLAETAIRNGQAQIADLGLRNIRLEHMDLMELSPDLGTFDYVVAHGLYSWIPDTVRDKLMSVSKRLLAPQGVAYISYNALPGCRIRQMFREMLLIHEAGESETQQRLQRARDLLSCLQESVGDVGTSGPFLKSEADFLVEQGPILLFHDELAEVYYPCYIHDFVAHAARHELKYLSEAELAQTTSGRFPKHIVDKVNAWSGGDRVRREMYYDFLKLRMFRRTLLCHSDAEMAEQPIPGRIRDLYAASAAKPVSSRPDLAPNKAEEFRGFQGAGATTAHPLAKAALLALGSVWPESIHFRDLLAETERLTGDPAEEEGLIQILLGTAGAGLVEFHLRPPRCVSKPGPFPETTALARWEACHGKALTTLRHTFIEVKGDLERRLLSLLDGTRDVAALTRELRPMVSEPDRKLAVEIEANLGKLARFGLLVK